MVAWIAAGFFVLLVIGFREWKRSSPKPDGSSALQSEATVDRLPQSSADQVVPVSNERLREFENDPLVGGLLDPVGSATRDLAIVAGVIEAWQANFPHQGNPVGENVEITAALTGRNPLKLALIPANHPAINRRGELCDRWTTPLFFHQISGTQMELRSAGPDRKLYTSDDLVWTP